jgi:hypothetical protein
VARSTHSGGIEKLWLVSFTATRRCEIAAEARDVGLHIQPGGPVMLLGGCAVPGDDVAGPRLAAGRRCQQSDVSTIVTKPTLSSASMVHGVVIVTARAGGFAEGMTDGSFTVPTPVPPSHPTTPDRYYAGRG